MRAIMREHHQDGAAGGVTIKHVTAPTWCKQRGLRLGVVTWLGCASLVCTHPHTYLVATTSNVAGAFIAGCVLHQLKQ